MTLFQPGDLFYTVENGLFTLYKVLLKGENEVIYVRVFWPESSQPDAENVSSFDLRTSCESLDTAALSHPVFLRKEAVSSEELEGYTEFIRIREGIQSRSTALAAIMSQANEQLEAENWEAAIHLYTEAASFSKYSYEIFDKRGMCYLKTGDYSEAIADFEHSISLNGKGKDTLYNCGLAYYRSGKHLKAVEKLEALEPSDEQFNNAQSLLRVIRGKN